MQDRHLQAGLPVRLLGRDERHEVRRRQPLHGSGPDHGLGPWRRPAVTTRATTCQDGACTGGAEQRGARTLRGQQRLQRDHVVRSHDGEQLRRRPCRRWSASRTPSRTRASPRVSATRSSAAIRPSRSSSRCPTGCDDDQRVHRTGHVCRPACNGDPAAAAIACVAGGTVCAPQACDPLGGLRRHDAQLRRRQRLHRRHVRSRPRDLRPTRASTPPTRRPATTTTPAPTSTPASAASASAPCRRRPRLRPARRRHRVRCLEHCDTVDRRLRTDAAHLRRRQPVHDRLVRPGRRLPVTRADGCCATTAMPAPWATSASTAPASARRRRGLGCNDGNACNGVETCDPATARACAGGNAAQL